MRDSEMENRKHPTRARFGYLHAHRFLIRSGLSIANAFAWIFVFQYYFIQTESISLALIGTIAMYALSQVATLILTPISAAHLRRGVKHAMVYGVLVASSAYVYLGATLADSFNGNPAGWGIAVFALLIGAYRALYWIPYQLEASTDNRERSRLPIVYEALIALMPAFAGITMMTVDFAYIRILFGGAVILILSLVPIMKVRDLPERFSWHYKETFRQLFREAHSRIINASVAGGLQSAVLFLIWPISVFLIVGSDYETLGIILSATLLAILFLRYIYRKLGRKMQFERSITVQVFFSFSGWAMRLFVGSPVGVFLADSYSHASSPRSSHSIDAFAFEQSADNGSFIDEYTALKEMGLAIGRILACVIFGGLIGWTTLPVAFAVMLILAGIASAVSIIMERQVAPAVF
ncbi:MAG: hypothetical protein NUV88_01105 [Candidatus Kaiserbacteria bacterium]|nr:hypothetical protein [Candidatus Kaiserbacteria bacterium]